MFRNYLKIALRNFSRNSLYTFLNGFGLILGLTCSLLILLWVNFEYSVDRYHPDGERIHTAYWYGLSDAGEITFTQGASPYVLHTYLSEYDGVETSVFYKDGRELMLQYDEDVYKEQGALATTSLFEVFDYPMVVGSIENAKNNLKTIFISDELAAKMIGEDWMKECIGATLKVDDQDEMTIAGVFKKIDKRSSNQFDFVVNIEQLIEQDKDLAQSWASKIGTVYAKLAKGVDAKMVQDYVDPHYRKTDGYGVGGDALLLFPFEDNHLYTEFEQGKAVGGRIQYIRIFLGTAIFLLLIACINFINLSTAQSSKRSKEVGIRKTVGARRENLVIQFLFETGLLVFIAMVVALAICSQLLPVLNNFTQQEAIIPFHEPIFWVAAFGLWALLTLTAGLYPAFVLSIYKPARVLKESISTRGGHAFLRKALVVFQFSLSSILIVATITVHNQLNYIQNENLGLDRTNVVMMSMIDAVQEKYDVLREKLMESPVITHVFRTTSPPIDIGWISVGFDWEGRPEDQSNYFYQLNTGADFADVFGLEVLDGRFFDDNIQSDSSGLVVNETAVEHMKIDDPVGKLVTNPDGDQFRILGVVKDFPFKSVTSEVEPLMIRYFPSRTSQLLLKTAPGSTVAAIDQLKTAWSSIFPNYPLEFEFLDDAYAKMYQGEMIISKLAFIFAGLAILISCLGLFGLITFIALQKTKEIGIRKVLGASIGSIVELLSKDFLQLVVIALVISIPLAWYLTNQWLENYAFRIDVEWWVFALAGMVAVLMTMLTISYQAIRAALANPAKALKTE